MDRGAKLTGRRHLGRTGAILSALALWALGTGCRHGGGPEGPQAPRAVGVPRAPEGASGWTEKALLVAQKQAVATANPYASEAGIEVLRKGGSAADAAVAIALVLGLTEPQSSGIGGGGLALYYDAKARVVHSFDGRETAPAAATPDMFLGPDGKPPAFHAAVVGGRSVATPSELRLLEALHKQHGRLPFRDLLQPAIRLATDGFQLGKRLHKLLSRDKFLARDPEAAAYFYEADGRPKAVGTVIKNPAYAEVLRTVAEQGVDAFYTGVIAEDIVRKVRGHETNPGRLALEDLRSYKVVERPPLCATFRSHNVCGAGPPTSGGVTVLQILKLHELVEPTGVPQVQPYATHLFADAGNLAFADRNQYIADPDFVALPLAGLLADGYLRGRAQLLRKDRSLGLATAGTPPGAVAHLGSDELSERAATSHVSVLDAEGNALALTVTIEDVFGSRQMVRGFLLNNELTDFSLAPSVEGRTVVNRIEARKRPRSSMAPTLVLGQDGALQVVIGSPGGSAIINYVAQSLIAILDWKLDVQAALNLPHVGARNGPLELEKGTAAQSYQVALEAMGHTTRVLDHTSGLSAIQIIRGHIEAGVDPRREGVALGD